MLNNIFFCAIIGYVKTLLCDGIQTNKSTSPLFAKKSFYLYIGVVV